VRLFSATIRASFRWPPAQWTDLRADRRELVPDSHSKDLFLQSFLAHECSRASRRQPKVHGPRCSVPEAFSSIHLNASGKNIPVATGCLPFALAAAGNRKITPLIRKYSSRAKAASLDFFSRLRDVEKINRGAGFPGLPFGSPSGNNESNARCVVASSSCTPSKNKVLGAASPFPTARKKLLTQLCQQSTGVQGGTIHLIERRFTQSR